MESSVNVYQICLFQVCVQVLDMLLIFCLVDLSDIGNGVLKSPTIIVWESKSFYKSLRTCLMYLGAPVLGP